MSRMSIARKISTSVSVVLASLALLVGILKVFSLLETPFIEERIPSMTLIIVSSLVISLFFEHKARLDELCSRMEELQEGRFESLQRQVDPRLNKVFGHLVHDAFSNALSAARNQEISFTDMRIFPIYYREALLEFRGGTFLAVSLATDRYWAHLAGMTEPINRFIQNGGTMRRIFLVEDEQNLSDEESRYVTQQANLGVECYLVRRSSLDLDDQRFFLVDQAGSIGWTVQLNPHGEISKVTATSREDRIRELLRAFDHHLLMAVEYRVGLTA